MIGFAAAGGHPSWLAFVSDTQFTKEKNKTTVLTFVSADVIPRSPTWLAGFAWFYDDTGDPPAHTAFTITSHNAPDGDANPYNEVRDSTHNPNNWYPHNVILNTGAGAATFCIADLSDTPHAGISFDEATKLVKVTVKNRDLTGDFPDHVKAAAFTIIVEELCPDTMGTEDVGNANDPAGPIPLGIVVHQVETETP